jgi:hypothetical protein
MKSAYRNGKLDDFLQICSNVRFVVASASQASSQHLNGHCPGLRLQKKRMKSNPIFHLVFSILRNEHETKKEKKKEPNLVGLVQLSQNTSHRIGKGRSQLPPKRVRHHAHHMHACPVNLTPVENMGITTMSSG